MRRREVNKLLEEGGESLAIQGCRGSTARTTRRADAPPASVARSHRLTGPVHGVRGDTSWRRADSYKVPAMALFGWLKPAGQSKTK